MKTNRLLLLCFFGIAAQSPAAPFPECLKTRCALDIGSSAIKMQVAQVDVCSQLVLKTLGAKRADAAFDQLTKQKQAIQSFQQLARSMGSEKCRGIATAAFRTPAGTQLAAKLASESETRITVIPPEKEGVLEVAGALARASLNGAEMKRAVVWGLGSTSQQWTPADQSPPLDLPIASSGFAERVRAEIKQSKAASPNPMSLRDITAARALADKIVDHATFPEALRKKLSAPDAVVLGIGGTLSLSVKKQAGAGERLKLGMVQDAIKARVDKSDRDPIFFGAEHAPTQLTNLILVESFLRKLGIHEVRLVETDLTDGALVYPELWR